MMTETPNTQSEPIPALEAPAATAQPYRPRKRHALAALAAVLLLGAGAAGGAFAINARHASAEMAPVVPVAISSLPASGIVSLKGQVAEIFGNKFILSDGGGRALVETGRAGEGGKLVAMNEPVTVQGRFEDGFLHASFVVHGDGKIEAIGPVGPPPGPRGPHEPHGPGARPGPKDGPRPLADAGPGHAGPADDAGPHADRGPMAGPAGPDATAPKPATAGDQPALPQP